MDVTVTLTKYICPTVKDFVLRCEFCADDHSEVFTSSACEAATPGRRPANPTFAASFAIPSAGVFFRFICRLRC
jgi:hypothetical protein